MITMGEGEMATIWVGMGKSEFPTYMAAIQTLL